MSQIHLFTCHKRAYVNFGLLDFGFVLHKKGGSEIQYNRRQDTEYRKETVESVQRRAYLVLGLPYNISYFVLSVRAQKYLPL